MNVQKIISFSSHVFQEHVQTGTRPNQQTATAHIFTYTHKHTERHTERHTDRHTHTDTDTQTDTDTHTDTHRLIHTHTFKHTNRIHTHTHTFIQLPGMLHYMYEHGNGLAVDILSPTFRTFFISINK